MFQSFKIYSMYSVLLVLHNVFRWLVLISLLYSILRSFQGYRGALPFTPQDNAIRHWTATLAHIQLLLGIVLYTQSPLVHQYFATDAGNLESLFFSLIHISLMLLAIVLITIGSAKAKRQTTDLLKFKTILVWFSIALFVIFIAIPWPFSPLAQRPYLRLQ